MIFDLREDRGKFIRGIQAVVVTGDDLAVFDIPADNDAPVAARDDAVAAGICTAGLFGFLF